jgi:hypothetical protein
MQEFMLHLLTPTPDGSKCQKILSPWRSSWFLSRCRLIFIVMSYLEAVAILCLSCYLFKMSWSSYLADLLGYIVDLPRTVMDAAEWTEYLLVALEIGIFKIYCSNFGNLYSTDCPASETSRLRGRSVPPFCNYCKNWVFKIVCIQIEF